MIIYLIVLIIITECSKKIQNIVKEDFIKDTQLDDDKYFDDYGKLIFPADRNIDKNITYVNYPKLNIKSNIISIDDNDKVLERLINSNYSLNQLVIDKHVKIYIFKLKS